MKDNSRLLNWLYKEGIPFHWDYPDIIVFKSSQERMEVTVRGEDIYDTNQDQMTVDFESIQSTLKEFYLVRKGSFNVDTETPV
jgi:hypothetical protein